MMVDQAGDCKKVFNFHLIISSALRKYRSIHSPVALLDLAFTGFTETQIKFISMLLTELQWPR